MIKKFFLKKFFNCWLILLHYLIAFFLMTLMLITTIDVIGRYIFNYPLPGSTELTEFCLGLLIFSSLPVICKSNQHISVDLLENKFSKNFKKRRDFLIQIILFMGIGFLTYGTYLLTKRARRDFLVSEILGLPMSFFYFLTTLFLLFSMIIIAINLFTNFKNNKNNHF